VLGKLGLGGRTRTGHPGSSSGRGVRPLLAHFCVFFGLVELNGTPVPVLRKGVICGVGKPVDVLVVRELLLLHGVCGNGLVA
jgi:hypothetical protein